jgi:hypothetical protein
MPKKIKPEQTQSFSDVKQKATEYLEAYEYQAALTYLKFCIKLKPDSTEILELLGLKFFFKIFQRNNVFSFEQSRFSN